tara:strand:+ start:326 stop:568 length:243 start_codon:yes stop_codon:yes gene_type:complete
MQNDFFGFMGPLDKRYCDIFFALGVLSLISLVLGVVIGVLNVLTHKNKVMGFMNLVVATIGPVISYLALRVLYQMCNKSL